MFLPTVITVILIMGQVATPSATPHPGIPGSCEVTLPNGYDPLNTFPYAQAFTYGHPGLSTTVPLDGVYAALLEPGNNLAWNKWVWVREAPGGPLTVDLTFHGERTTTIEPRVEIPDGYGETGVQVTVPQFPEEGCWTVTASTPHATESVTIWVVFVDNWLAKPKP